MDNDSHKNEHITSPKGPEDASNIADEYPSPEREQPQPLHEQLIPEQAQVQSHETQDEHQHQHEHDAHHHRHEDTDMQTELANQMAAQAIEAAVAAQVRANANADANVTADVLPGSSGQPGDQAMSQANANANTTTDVNMSSHHQTSDPRQRQAPGQRNEQAHVQTQPQSITSTHDFRTSQHQPRQPTFPRVRAPLPAYPIRPHALSHAQSNSSTQLNSTQQIQVLREAYAKNPNPSKKELESLAEKTGRPWNKIREYFRQRRNKLRGLEDLEQMVEPGRASGWLQVAYRAASPTTHVSQLSLYNSYKHRFDPYSITTPLLGGQELIQLACATFPGCDMARDDGEYVLKGLTEKEKEKEGDANDDENATGNNAQEQEEWEKGMEGLVEPLRAGSWLLSSFQQQNDPNAPSTLTQTELYTSYAARFSSILTNASNTLHAQEQSRAEAQARNEDTVNEVDDHEQGHNHSAAEVRAAQDQAAELKAFEDAGLGETAGEDDGGGQDQSGIGEDENENGGGVGGAGDGMAVDEHQSLAQLSLDVGLPDPASDSATPPPPTAAAAAPTQAKKENRLLNPLELINLTRMTFPKCEPMIDQAGRFVIRGLERREGAEPGSKGREREMFPFALHSEVRPGDAFVGLMKRKLGLLVPEADQKLSGSSESGSAEGVNGTNGKDHRDSENGMELERDGKRRKIATDQSSKGNTNELRLGDIHAGREMDEEMGMELSLSEGDRELIDGLKRFRGSKLGEQVREVCVTQ